MYVLTPDLRYGKSDVTRDFHGSRREGYIPKRDLCDTKKRPMYVFKPFESKKRTDQKEKYVYTKETLSTRKEPICVLTPDLKYEIRCQN